MMLRVVLLFVCSCYVSTHGSSHFSPFFPRFVSSKEALFAQLYKHLEKAQKDSAPTLSSDAALHYWTQNDYYVLPWVVSPNDMKHATGKSFPVQCTAAKSVFSPDISSTHKWYANLPDHPAFDQGSASSEASKPSIAIDADRVNADQLASASSETSLSRSSSESNPSVAHQKNRIDADLDSGMGR
jgi:hypothetical protein